MSAPVISVEHLVKRFRVPLDHGGTLQYRFSHPVSSSRYRQLVALDDVSFSVGAGEILGITGPNGCGKSTLLKVLSRIYRPDRGRVRIRGHVSPFLELGVGFKPDLTARENIFLGGAVLGLTHRQLEDRVDDVLDFAELREFADQKLKNFSSGMGVRLAFSVAMLADADVLLMDEVLAVGDARFQQKCFDVFAYYKETGRTIVLVSHDLNSLETYCDRVILLQAGRLRQEGDPHEVISEYRRIVGSMSDAPPSQPEAASGPGRLTPSRRWGTRDLEVLDVHLLDARGQEHHTFFTGQPMTIAIDYLANAALDDFVCGIGVRRRDGVLVAAEASSSARHHFAPVQPGHRGTITYTMPELRMLAGSHLLTVILCDVHQNHAYDRVEDLLEFRVIDEAGRMGVVDLGATWAEVPLPSPVPQRSAVAAPEPSSPVA